MTACVLLVCLSAELMMMRYRQRGGRDTRATMKENRTEKTVDMETWVIYGKEKKKMEKTRKKKDK